MLSARERPVACGLPCLTPALLERLTLPTEADLLIPRSQPGDEPLCATWSAACAVTIVRRIERGDLKAARLVEELRVREELSRLESKSLPDRIMDVSEPS